jgi:hypothetical protein
MNISIKDLQMTQELDPNAMASIRGGYNRLPNLSPGLLGYEGQPGKQGGHNGANGPVPGLLGYEGQPGNQGG